MKRNSILIAALFGMLIFSGSMKAQSLGDVLNSKTVNEAVSKVSGAATSTKPQSIVGVWKYKGAACAYESDNVVAKMGSKVVTEKIEEQLDGFCKQAGFNPGASNFIFTAKGTFVNSVGTQKYTGSYTYNKVNGALVLNYQQLTVSINGNVIAENGITSLLFDANKMMKLVSSMSSKTSAEETVKSISAMLNECKGVKVGFKIGK
ncbi:lipocalin-like domain-containing protein [uncultured Bacteroides sp.]|uniref:lipocalin-like domain-containing protein n=1 Tax=uncultured Bacteroides sp. TaxID=162156 RepID=UPI002AA90BDA|nr:DUF4923 family protein [uncultured Bacteroides sp.]